HLGNPCGHTFCGECGWDWVVQNRKAPTCPICRTRLIVNVPMIPNYTVDSTVEKHVARLSANGDAGWCDGGDQYKEWRLRKG
ncbi:hypothetical protein OBBRIDRAFT_718507, partial [Obba rivulosa]